jgi:hypothetical protein
MRTDIMPIIFMNQNKPIDLSFKYQIMNQQVFFELTNFMNRMVFKDKTTYCNLNSGLYARFFIGLFFNFFYLFSITYQAD